MPDDRTIAELGRGLERVERDIGEIEAVVRGDAMKFDRLVRELDVIRARADRAEALAETAKKALDKRLHEEQARQDAMGVIVRWGYLVISVLTFVVLGWTGQFSAMFGKVQSLLGQVK
jgi:uncharacterized membrane protein